MKVITPEYLLARGFIKVTEETDLPYSFPWVPECAGETYIEEKFHRQMFGVNFHNLDGEMCVDKSFDCLIWVQEDAGCGFVLIPCPYDWDIESFEMLYYSIRRAKR